MKDINGYEGLYAVTEDGKIWSYAKTKGRHKGLFLAQGVTQSGYNNVVLCRNKTRITKTVHRLVAETYICNFENKQTVNHKNGIKTDNRVENLEWATNSEQQIHARENGLNKVSDKQRKSSAELCKKRRVLTIQQANEIRYVHQNKNISVSEISRLYDVNRKVICRIVHNKSYID